MRGERLYKVDPWVRHWGARLRGRKLEGSGWEAWVDLPSNLGQAYPFQVQSVELRIRPGYQRSRISKARRGNHQCGPDHLIEIVLVSLYKALKRCDGIQHVFPFRLERTCEGDSNAEVSECLGCRKM